MSKTPLQLIALSTLLAIPAFAQSTNEHIQRRGFTLGLSLGGGGTYISAKGGDSKNEGGIGGLNLGIGGFLTPDLALLFKTTAMNFGSFDRTLDTGLVGVAGPAVEYWLGDHFNLVAGAGLGTLYVQPGFGSLQREYGVGAMAGLNYFPFAVAHHGLGISVDVSPIFTGNYTMVTYQIGLSWQYY